MHLGIGYSYRGDDTATYKLSSDHSLAPNWKHKISNVDNTKVLSLEGALTLGPFSLQSEWVEADVDAAEGLFAKIEADIGQADELHFVAGVMPEIGPDEFDLEKDRLQVNVNMLGCIAWGNAAARRFQARKAGSIVGVSSIAQDRGRIGRPVYNASKAGMDTYLEALRNRLWRHGVRVTTIRPGFVETPMTAGLQLKGAISADKAAELILKAQRQQKAIVYVPGKWRLIMFVIRSIPSFVFRKLSL